MITLCALGEELVPSEMIRTGGYPVARMNETNTNDVNVNTR